MVPFMLAKKKKRKEDKIVAKQYALFKIILEKACKASIQSVKNIGVVHRRYPMNIYLIVLRSEEELIFGEDVKKKKISKWRIMQNNIFISG